MTFTGGCPQGRSQHFTFSRRGLLQKAVSAALLCLTPSQGKYPKAQFVIGDKVADYWTDEFDNECIEYGEVLGFCWHPYEQTWAYLINWTSGQGPNSLYPCFDEHLTIGGDLRLVSHG